MKPLFFVLAAVVLVALIVRRRKVTRTQVVLGLLIAAGLAVYGTGVIHLPDLDQVLSDLLLHRDGSGTPPRTRLWSYLAATSFPSSSSFSP